MRNLLLGGLLLVAGSAQSAPGPSITAQCVCEHFGSQYDQFCEGEASLLGNWSAFPSTRLRYRWTASPGSVIYSGGGPNSTTASVDCISSGRCDLFVTLRADVYTVSWDSSQGRTETYLMSSDTNRCLGGTFVPF